MKNIRKTLETRMKNVEDRFNQLDQERQVIAKRQDEILTEMVRLQGENKQLQELLDDFKDEPKEK